jgi:hypothetical protein
MELRLCSQYCESSVQGVRATDIRLRNPVESQQLRPFHFPNEDRFQPNPVPADL